MLFDIHTAMQDADNFDLAFSGLVVKNDMFANAVFEIPFPDIVARAAKIGFVRQSVERTVNLRQIAHLLRFAPFFSGIAANGKQIISGFLLEDERPHLVFTFQLIQYVLQRIIGCTALFAFDQSAAQRFQLGLALFQ